MGIILLILPVGFLLIGIGYFTVLLLKLAVPVEKYRPYKTITISKKDDKVVSIQMSMTGKGVEALNTIILLDKYMDLLLYVVHIMKSYDKVVEMHNMETRLEEKINMPKQILEIPSSMINQASLTRFVYDLKNKGDLLWVQN